MKNKSVTALLLAVLLLFHTPFSLRTRAEGQKPIVYVTTYALESFAQLLAGDRIELRNFLPPAADLHSWEPTAGDMSALLDADLLLVNGAGLEHWLGKVREIAGEAKVVDTSVHVDVLPAYGYEEDAHESEDAHEHEHDHAHEHDHDHEHEHEHDHDHDHECEHAHHHSHGAFDPHFWLDPYCAEEQAEAVYEALVELFPVYENEFKRNHKALKERFKELQEQADRLGDAPGRAFVVTHGGFRYLAERYELEQLALNVADHSEATPRGLAEVIARAEELGLKTVLYDSRESSKQAQIVSDAVGGGIVAISTLEYVSEEERADGRDYFERMSEMLDTLQAALDNVSE